MPAFRKHAKKDLSNNNYWFLVYKLLHFIAAAFFSAIARQIANVKET